MRIVICVILCLAVPLDGNLASAASDAEFRISTDNSPTDQNYPAVAVGLGGRFAAVWTDYRNGQGDVYAQLFDSGATFREDNFQLNDDSVNAWQLEPALAADWYGRYFAVWKDYRNGSYPFGPDVYFQSLDSLGMVGINCNITTEKPDSSHQSPAVAASGWGGIVSVWTDLRSKNWDVYARALDPTGAPLGSSVRVNDDTGTEPQHEPDIALSTGGWYVAAWYDGRNGNDDIYIQKFDSSGQRIGTNIKVNSDTETAKQKFPSVAIGGNGMVYVVWTDWRNGLYPANPDIYLQKYDSELTGVGTNVRVCQDGTAAAQRDPQVAADRMGNACVVWSDSAGGDWNVSAQMIEYTGRTRDPNFSINVSKTGKQLMPDVALDGYDLYFVWADDRSGDYDIYGRIIRYNDPALIASPSQITLSKDMSEADPDPVKLHLQNAGYGELDYRLVTAEEWIALSKTEGTTPDSINASLAGDGLDFGVHYGSIRLIDLTHNDSTAVVPVAFTITGPVIDPQPDTLRFRALMEYGAPASQTLTIANAGTGLLDWQLTSSADWLEVNPTSGSQGTTITVGCLIDTLTTDDYSGYIIVSDSLSINQVETVLVTLSIESNLAYLAAQPDSVCFYMAVGDSAADSIQILNLGEGNLNWCATCSDEWLVLSANNGDDDDWIGLQVAADNLTPGTHTAIITVEDSASFNVTVEVPVVVEVVPPDTILIPFLSVAAGDAGQMSVFLHNNNALSQGYFKIGYDPERLRIDSLVMPPGQEMSQRVSSDVDTVLSCFHLIIAPDSMGFDLEAGEHYLGEIYFAADTVADTAFFDVPQSDSFYLEVNGRRLTPHLAHGGLEISSPTFVDGRGRNQLPTSFSLGQNYPNPFNAGTAIGFDLSRIGAVRLEVFNILGQLVTVLVDRTMPAGSYSVAWDGRDMARREMPSGIYFYRMNAPGFSSVRKMVLLK